MQERPTKRRSRTRRLAGELCVETVNDSNWHGHGHGPWLGGNECPLSTSGTDRRRVADDQPTGLSASAQMVAEEVQHQYPKLTSSVTPVIISATVYSQSSTGPWMDVPLALVGCGPGNHCQDSVAFTHVSPGSTEGYPPRSKRRVELRHVWAATRQARREGTAVGAVMERPCARRHGGGPGTRGDPRLETGVRERFQPTPRRLPRPSP